MLATEQEVAQKTARIQEYIKNYLLQIDVEKHSSVLRLRESMSYSLLNGGKRFRPVLSLMVADLFNKEEQSVMAFAAAVEMIHTYSLIHDDLPCMDNDDIRRGQPTNHKKYDEPTALLAGDALLTEAFLLIAKNYHENGFLCGQLISLLSEAAGIRGMIGGQVIDISAQPLSFEVMQKMHELKTGCLIRVAVEGAALISGASASEIKLLREWGLKLGLAFQVADDILDQHEKDQNQRSFVNLLGLEKTKTLLEQLSSDCLLILNKFSTHSSGLEYLVQYNRSRLL